MSRKIALVAALDGHRAIGNDNQLLWHLSDDLKRFKAITTGHTVVMGRKTFESIGRPLPKRRNVVLTRDPHFSAEGVEVIHSLEDVLALEDDLMVIGGGEIYSLFLPFATHLYLTYVDTSVPQADAFFPQFDTGEWWEVSREFHPADEKHVFSFSWVDLERSESVNS